MKRGIVLIAGVSLVALVGILARPVKTIQAQRRPMVSTTTLPAVEVSTVVSSHIPSTVPQIKIEPAPPAPTMESLCEPIDDSTATALMAEPNEVSLSTVRKSFLNSRDTEQRLLWSHVLIAQNRRYGFPIEIDREVQTFLHHIVMNEQAIELRRSAIWALQEWATPESIATLRDLMVNPVSLSDVADSAEALAHTQTPEAVSAALSILRSSSDPSQRLMSAKILWQISATAPQLGVEPTLRGEVRQTLESMLATTNDAWLRTRISQMIQALL